MSKTKEINYEQIIAALLLNFESIDNIDFSLIIEKFKKENKVDVYGLWYDVENINKYVKYEKNGIISLKKGITLDYFIEDENQTLHNKLSNVAGKTVMKYFSNFDIEKYKNKKEKKIIQNRNTALNEANVLLISDIQDDYDELIKYGFKNVDYFKSIVRADSYFAKHPKELEKYHLILEGNQNVQRCTFEGDVDLKKTINILKNTRDILKINLNRKNYPDYIELVTYLCDQNNHKNWDIKELTYNDLFDRIVENMIINHTLEKLDLKDNKFVPIQDYINPNRLPLPTKKSDLKILYLGADMYADRIASELGLNIDFKEDNNCSLGRYVKNNLGKYDVIIVTSIYSGNLLSMNGESTEQCKDTGRELTLFVSYDDCCLFDHSLGNEIKLNYVYGGNIAPNLDFHSKKFKVLRQPIEVDKKYNKYYIMYCQSEYSKIKAIIESSINFYNEALIEMGKPSINDLDFKTFTELDNEYALAFEYERKRKEEELAPIKLFDNIRYSITSYLNYKKIGLIKEIPEGIKIIEEKNQIRVENLYQGRILCVIVFSKEYEHDNFRIFEIQTLSKKGILSNPQTIGVYTSKYESFEDVPNRPNQEQENALISIEKKINVILKPLNEEAWKKHFEQDAQESKKLNLKRKSKIKNNHLKSRV